MLTPEIISANDRCFLNDHWEYDVKKHEEKYWKVAPGDRASYSQLNCGLIARKKGDYISVEHAGGGDYSGCTVTRSSYKIIVKEFASEVVDLYGSHGSYGVAVPISCDNEELIELLADLIDYPLVDEDYHSELEFKLAGEAWEDWAMGDFLSALGDFEIIDGKEDAFYEAFQLAGDNLGEYFFSETGGGMWIDVEKIAASVDADKLVTDGILERCE